MSCVCGAFKRSAFPFSLVAAFTSSMLLAAAPAHADCTPAAANGVTATCSGTTTNQADGAPGTSAGTHGYGTGAENNVTVEVLNGATVTGTDNGISLDENATVDNYGTVESTSGHGIEADDGNSTIRNYGTVTVGDDGIRVGKSNNTVINYGTIDATAGGGTAKGLVGFNGGNNEFINHGEIRASGRGIEVEGQGGADTVTNGATGTIFSGNWGVAFFGAGSLTNSGYIFGTDAAIYGFENDKDAQSVTQLPGGVIDGIIALRGGDDTINNYGIIDSDVRLGKGDDIFNNFAGALFDASASSNIGGNNDDDTFNNSGTVIGSINLGTGTNAFNNETGGLFNSGDLVNLNGLLTNDGTLSPGGLGAVQTTELTGNLLQNSGGTFSVDIDGAAADRIDVSGSADLAGTVAVNLLSLSASDFTILTSSNTTDSGLALGSVTDAILFDYDLELVFAPGEEVHLVISNVDFAVAGLNQNQTNIANNLEAAFNAGSGGLGSVLSELSTLGDLSSYASALDQLSPEIYGDTQLAALYSSLDFSSNLLSCRVNGADTAAIVREGQCLWAGAKARFLDRDQTSENIGFDQTAGQFAAGAQLALDPVWRLGFGIGYETSWLDTDTGATSDGDMVQGGVALKYNPGALLLAGTVSGGRGWYDTTRPMAFGAFAATAQGEQEIDVLSGRLRAAYVLGAPSLYFKPIVDAAVTRLDLSDVNETGAGAANLVVQGNETTVFSVSPALELGTEWWLSNGTLVRPFVRTGATWFSDDDVTVSASFAGAPAGIGPFAIRSEIDQVQADVAAGLEMVNGEDSALSLYYDGHFGQDIEIHAMGLKASATY
jgi:autotransporter-like protein